METPSALRTVRGPPAEGGAVEGLDLPADLDDPRDLLGMLGRAGGWG